MRIRKRILSFLLAAAMLTAFLPPAGAADTSSIRGTISATMRIDYPQLLGELQERGVSVELFRNGSSLGKLSLTREASGVSLGGGTAAVSLRNTDGGALGGGQEPGYLDLAVGGLPQGSYELVFTGRGYVTFRQSVELDKYDRHIILGTGDATFSLGDVDGSGRVDETDRAPRSPGTWSGMTSTATALSTSGTWPASAVASWPRAEPSCRKPPCWPRRWASSAPLREPAWRETCSVSSGRAASPSSSGEKPRSFRSFWRSLWR